MKSDCASKWFARNQNSARRATRRSTNLSPISGPVRQMPILCYTEHLRAGMKTWLSGLLVAVVVLTVVSGEAQQSTKVPRIGYLALSDPSSHLFDSFRKGLREIGYV